MRTGSLRDLIGITSLRLWRLFPRPHFYRRYSGHIGYGLSQMQETQAGEESWPVVIDYFGLMQGRGRVESRQQEVSEISRSLKILAKELNVPVVTMSQLSRGPESRNDHRPMLSDLRESGAIEQDADIVMFLYRDDYYNPDTDKKNIAEVIIAKHRNGSTGTIELRWFGEYTKFANLKRDDYNK